ncbi:MAG: efflux RND transporter permease subunit [Phascolarctobacterium sp.]|nr:efflux RND transporter permease subunit [Phascolarctobacterium sp.]
MIGTFIRRPVFTTMFILLLVVFGIKCYPEIGVDMNPDVDLPIVSVRVTYDGASPEEMETLVTKPIENRVSQVSGIKTLSSTVLEGFSETVLEFELGVDPQVKASEVREKVSSVRKALPDDIDEPSTQTVDLNARAIVAWSFSSPTRSRSEIRRVIEDNIKDELQMVDGVSEVTVAGASKRVIRILVDPEKLAEYDVPFQTIRTKLNANNYNTPGGKVRNKEMEITVRTIGKYQTIDDVKKVVIGNYNGKNIFITDVAEVKDDWEDETSFASANGEPSVLCFVRKQSKTNTVDVTDNINNRMEELKKTVLPPDITVSKVRDRSKYIRENIADVWNAILFGGFLALAITYLFLRNLRATIIGGLCIPTSIIATFWLVKGMDFSFNNMSLMGMSLAVGILIDDAIVLIENIFRHMEMGKSPFQAAKEATEELTLAIIATSLTLMAVFVPIGSMGEIIGQYFKQFGLVVAFAVFFSTVVAFTMTPMVSAYWLKKVDEKTANRNKYLQKFLDKFEEGFQSIREIYNNLMLWCMSRPRKIIAVSVLSLAINLALIPFLGKEFQPTYDSGEFSVSFQAPSGTSLKKTVELAEPLRKTIQELPELEVVAMTVGNYRDPVNKGTLDVRLKPSNERTRSMMQIMDELRADFKDVEGMKVAVLSGQGVGGRDSRPVQIGMRGNDIKQIKAYANELAEKIRHLPGATDVDISDSDEEPEILIKIDHTKAAAYGLDATEVGKVVEMAYMGKSTSNSYTIGKNDYNVLIQTAPNRRTSINDVMNLRVSGTSGGFIRLGDIASIEYSSGPTRIEREDKSRQIVVYANAVGTTPGDLINTITERLIPEMNMADGYSYKLVGSVDTMNRAFREIYKAVVLAIVIVYMTLAAQFESFSQPLIIMASLPFAIVGAILGLLVVGQTANMMSLIGFTMLLGLVTKNAILLVDYANQQRDNGVPLEKAVLEACSLRLRPIFMTTFSTILGMMPIALGIGEGAELRQSMGVVLVGGLTTSTMLTLVIIPLIYVEFEKFKAKHYHELGENIDEVKA